MTIMQRTFRSWRRPWWRWRAIADRRDRLPVGAGATRMLHGELQGLALDFTTGTALVRDTGTPANNFDGDPVNLLTYTSPNLKLVWNAGLLGYATHNMVPRSQEFSDATGWVRAGTTVAADATAAPDGTVTADSLADTAANATHDVHPGAGITLAALPHRFSVYLKKGTHTKAHVSLASAALGHGVGVDVDLDAGTIGAPVNYGAATDGAATIEALANGWYRVTVSVTSNAGTYYTTVWMTDAAFNRTYLGTTTQFYVWGAQLQRLPCHDATYFPTTSAARYGLPIDRHPITDAALGILIEEQRTNLFLYSAALDNAAYTKTNTTISANALAAPDGQLTADKVVETTAAATTHTILQSVISLAANTYTASVFAKAAGRTKFRFTQPITETFSVGFDLVTKTMTVESGTPLRYGMQELPDGWFFCWMTYTTTSTHNVATTIYLKDASGNPTYTGDGVSGLYVWGFQLEVGAFPTSHIQTVASQVTRAMDLISLAATKFPYSATAGLLLGDYVSSPGTVASCVASLNNGAADRVELFHDMASSGSDSTAFHVVAASAVSATLVVDADGSQNASHRFAGTWQVNDFAASLDGMPVLSDAAGALPSGISTLAIGYNSINAAQIGGHVASLLYLPRRVPNTDLQRMTA